MRPNFLMLLLFLSSLSMAQRQLTTVQINRLADAGKVYGYIKYFHPFLQYKNINWDSAFAANVEGIIYAKNKEEYAAVMQRMFSVLDDNLTTCTSTPKSDTVYKIQSTTYSIKDSILYVNMNDAPLDGTWSSLQVELKNISKVKGVIFDLRRPVNSKFIDGVAAGALEWTTSYYKGEIINPSYRSMGYTGYANGYFKESGLRPMYGHAKKEVPLVFIVSNEGQIPVTAIALQQKGKAAIIQEEGRKLLPGNSVNFYIHDSLLIKLRTSDAVSEDGFLLSVQPDDTYSAGELSTATTKAEKLILNGFRKDVKLTQYAPPPITRTSIFTNQTYPSLGYRMLAAASIFSTIDHFFTDKNLMDKNWELSYKETIPKFIEARDSLEYMQAVAELFANINDSHGFIFATDDSYFSVRLNPIIEGRGSFIPPVITRVIENKVVVTGIYDDSVCKSIGIKKGDVILSIDGKNAIQMVEDGRKYKAASTKASQTFYICSFILFGKEGQIHKLKVVDENGKIKDVTMPTLRDFNFDYRDYVYRMFSYNEHTTIKMLTKDIGYADLTGRLKDSDNDSIVRMLKNTRAIIFDVRGWPHGDAEIDWNIFARNITIPGGGKEIIVAPSSPNINSTVDSRITTTYQDRSINHADWVYQGKTIVLTNESAQSYAEGVSANLKALCNATIIGSPTAGANGGVAGFNIPGNITLCFSQLGMLLPNGKSFQRYGVQPDIFVQPTIKGIQAGKDEVLDRAIKFIQTGK